MFTCAASSGSQLMFTRDELLAAARTQPIGGELPEQFTGAATDSRQVEEGDLFVALRGPSLDGHRFIPAAVQAGAAAILCSNPSEEVDGIPQLVVPDPLATLHELAH